MGGRPAGLEKKPAFFLIRNARDTDMKRICIFIVLLAAAAFPAACGTPFVRVRGCGFEVGDRPYRFGGVNMWYALYLGSTDRGRIRLKAELDTLHGLGLDNVRILGLSERSALKASLPRAVQTRPGMFDGELLKGLDFAIAEMGRRGMRAVVFLNNYWQWSGGMAQYHAWTSGDTIPDPDRSGDWGAFMRFSDRFLTDPAAQDLYRTAVRMLIGRRNTVNGLRYRDDPAIMAWELANEPRPAAWAVGEERVARVELFARWADETAAFIHSLDPNHLVTTGTEGLVGCLQDEDCFMKVHASPNIDYANLHLWPRNWGWFDPKHPDRTYARSESLSVAYVLRHIALAGRLVKPITLEEFGLDRDGGSFEPSSSTTYRDRFLDVLLGLVHNGADGDSPLSGFNIWAWGGYGRPAPVDRVMDDPGAFLGDQLGEPQGLNSVFVTDTSTVRILKTRARKFRE
jgi:mannan endo-1,4-beta-mannosidase